MGIATPTLPPVTSHSKGYNSVQLLPNSMSQDYHHQAGIFSFSNGFERSQQEQQQHIAQQIRRDKLRVQGFDPPPPPPPPLVGIEVEDQSSGLPVYETAGMLSEMFNFPSGGTATELLENQILQSYRQSRPTAAAEWYSQRGQMDLGESKNENESASQHQITSINANSAAAMQLFLMNPQQQQQRSPSPSPPVSTSSTLHMLLPNPALHNAHYTWLPNSANESNPSELPGVVEGQGLSLSLSSSLQHMEAAKAEEMRMGEGNMLFFGHAPPYQMKNHQQMHAGLGSSSFGTVNLLRNSKYAKAAQELLEEFCSVGRGHFKKNKFRKHNNNNNNSNPTTNAGAAAGNSSSSSKDQIPPLSAADRLEHQRRKVKLLSMLDEVDRRYNHYCEQMQMVVNSFDMVMGFGAAVPYTSLAQKAMSRHFRCLKDAIAAQLKHSCELLGEKDAGSSGVTKGETPRLRLLDQSLRQQRAFHQMGMMEQEAWRPQRGLPERSVNILRAWLFEHFLHPYPSDADKHLLARQTGLSRNQVSNWFINARVRLWKPMVEEMYQQEAKEEDGDPNQQGQGQGQVQDMGQDQDRDQSSGSASAQTPTPPAPTTTTTTTTTSSATAAPDSDPSFTPINRHCFLDTTLPPPQQPSDGPDMGPTLIRFGPTSGDVSLTLGLRHAGNLPEKNQFDFRGC